MDGKKMRVRLKYPPVGLKLKYKQVETRVRDLKPGDLVITDDGVIRDRGNCAARPVDDEGDQYFHLRRLERLPLRMAHLGRMADGEDADELTLGSPTDNRGAGCCALSTLYHALQTDTPSL